MVTTGWLGAVIASTAKTRQCYALSGVGLKDRRKACIIKIIKKSKKVS